MAYFMPMTPLFSLDMLNYEHIQRDLPDPSDVVTKVDTSDRGKGAHKVGLKSDGSLNAVDISRTADRRRCHSEWLRLSRRRDDGEREEKAGKEDIL
jgi:hypothetical protein